MCKWFVRKDSMLCCYVMLGTVLNHLQSNQMTQIGSEVQKVHLAQRRITSYIFWEPNSYSIKMWRNILRIAQ